MHVYVCACVHIYLCVCYEYLLHMYVYNAIPAMCVIVCI